MPPTGASWCDVPTRLRGWAAVEVPNRTVCTVHVIPLGDSRMHTVPICWCNPHRGTNKDGPPTTERIYTHNAILEG